LVAADAVDLEEVGDVAAAARPVVLVKGARPGLVGRHAGAVAGGASPADVAVGQDVRVGPREAVVLRLAVEERVGDLGRGVARLRGPIVELRDLEVAVPRIGRQGRRADASADGAVAVVDRGEHALVVAEDQPRLAGERVNHGDHAVLVGEAGPLIERDPRDAGAGVGERGDVVDIERRVPQRIGRGPDSG